MTERTPDGSAFGFSDITLPELENDPLSDEYVAESEPTPEVAPEPEAEPEPEPEPEPKEPDFDEQDQEFVAPETPQEEQARLWAGRYTSADALEKGYTDLQAEYTRDRQAQVALEQRQQQMEAVLAQLVPVLEQQLASQDPEALERYQREQAIREQAKQIAEAEVGPLREQLEFQRQQAQVDTLVNEFRARHPDVSPGSQGDAMVVQTIQDLGLNASNLDSLELAYEAGRDAYLKQVLRANPVLVESDEGIAYARIQARLLEGLAGAARPTPRPQPRGPETAYVETGEGGTPARQAASSDFDEFDEAMDSWAKERRSPLFGS